MTNRLINKVAIISGAARGIGKAAAIIFAREGAKVVIADLDDQGALDVVNQIKTDGNEAMYIRTNLTSTADVEALVAKTVETYGNSISSTTTPVLTCLPSWSIQKKKIGTK